MSKIYKAHPEKLRAIGVSNFSVKYLDRLLEAQKKDPENIVVPAVNQIELHPCVFPLFLLAPHLSLKLMLNLCSSCPQQDVVDFCRSRGIVITAYSPLGSDNSPLLENEIVKKIAAKYNVQPANVLISLQANRSGVTVLPKSVTNSRILSVYNFYQSNDLSVTNCSL